MENVWAIDGKFLAGWQKDCKRMQIIDANVVMELFWKDGTRMEHGIAGTTRTS